MKCDTSVLSPRTCCPGEQGAQHRGGAGAMAKDEVAVQAARRSALFLTPSPRTIYDTGESSREERDRIHDTVLLWES